VSLVQSCFHCPAPRYCLFNSPTCHYQFICPSFALYPQRALHIRLITSKLQFPSYSTLNSTRVYLYSTTKNNNCWPRCCTLDVISILQQVQHRLQTKHWTDQIQHTSTTVIRQGKKIRFEFCFKLMQWRGSSNREAVPKFWSSHGKSSISSRSYTFLDWWHQTPDTCTAFTHTQNPLPHTTSLRSIALPRPVISQHLFLWLHDCFVTLPVLDISLSAACLRHLCFVLWPWLFDACPDHLPGIVLRFRPVFTAVSAGSDVCLFDNSAP